jgi:hypothetical protein
VTKGKNCKENSLGMVLVELLARDVPYGTATKLEAALEQARAGRTPPYTTDRRLTLQAHEEGVVEEFKLIIDDCLAANDKARPSAATVHERLLLLVQATTAQTPLEL